MRVLLTLTLVSEYARDEVCMTVRGSFDKSNRGRLFSTPPRVASVVLAPCPGGACRVRYVTKICLVLDTSP